ncbi:hypothetical protein FA15DRAFT_703770 [Coprinopsis marcescibilis]|uniref:Thioester reductase (TE) domain-containing protein n=1 Tax=Coprinopsis marcescibilis TaxID=230819 RepID=A0A5C3KXJ3_COPMA|nr:hypothetical protein FA15DRAFT_703770 [Coprinopsis marcescibilis]
MSATRVAKMRQMLEHYAQTLPTNQTFSSAQAGNREVLITGTTGALGCYILAALLTDSSITRVYGLNRRLNSSPLTTCERQRRAFEERGLDPSLLDSDKLQILDGDLTQADLGLPEATFTHLKSSVTTVMHIAWSVNFKMPLKSFDPMMIGLVNLISFSNSSAFRPTIIFASSAIALQSAPAGLATIFEEHVPPSFALGSGYTEGKWVAERLLSRAADVCGLRSIIARVGQVSGGLNGTWNMGEWFPCLVMSAQGMDAFPTIDKARIQSTVSPVFFIPPTLCAKAFVDFSRCEIVGNKIVHLIHSQEIMWNSIIAATVSEEFKVPLVPFEEWIKALRARYNKVTSNGTKRADDRIVRDIPALRLVSGLELVMGSSARNPNVDASGVPFLDLTNAIRYSDSLRNPDASEIIGPDDVRLWIRYWNSLKNPSKKQEPPRRALL